MTRIACSCDTCKTNAAKIGATFPLKADVPDALAKKVKNPHGLVYDAHNPGAIGDVMRARLGLVPVA
jgi:hypothetical protein